MNKEEILKAINELPKLKTDNPISAMNSINVDDFMSAIDRLDKIPTYQDLLKENKQLKEKNNKAIEYLEHERFKREILLGLYETKYMRSIFNNILEILKGSEE